jgi:predicted hotdog family 3-hydroxylacyl-ACP dehydratase
VIISKDQIQSLIPQRPPFVMVDELIYSDDLVTRTRLQVTADNIFVENGLLREAGLLENIAQTAATRSGYSCSKRGEPVKVGYIGAVKNFDVFDLPKTSDILETEISISNQVFDVTVIHGSIKCKDRVLAQCEMKIFIINQKKLLL